MEKINMKTVTVIYACVSLIKLSQLDKNLKTIRIVEKIAAR